MRKSQRLTVDEMRLAFRLVGECCELGTSPLMWRAHLIEGLARMVDAPRGICDEEIVAKTAAESAMAGPVIMGYDAPALAGLNAYCEAGGFQIHPMFEVVFKQRDRAWTQTSRRLFPDESVWYGHRVVQDFMRPHCDESIHSRQPTLIKGWAHHVSLFRSWRARPFSERDRCMVHLVHDELATFWRRTPAENQIGRLPKRFAQVVRLLSRGLSEKQVAAELQLSPHTVHFYIRCVYKRLKVNSRFELLELARRSTPARVQLTCPAPD